MITTAPRSRPSLGGQRSAATLAGACSACIAMPALVIGFLLGTVVGHRWLGLLAGIVTSAGLVVALIGIPWRDAERRVIGLLGAQVADPSAYARVYNLMEGLCTASGLSRPQVLTVAVAEPNGAVLGRDARRGRIIVTEGLVGELSRIELEGVIAHLLCRLRAGDAARPTVAISLDRGPLAPVARRVDQRRHGGLPALADADRGAISLTRYPPGLAAALEKMAAYPGRKGSLPAITSALWIAPLEGGGLAERVEMLREA